MLGAASSIKRGAEMAVADLNAKGGVLGQNVELIVGDDFCDPDQAVALARKLVSDGVVFVAGHLCSHASIAAAKVYEEADILMITPGSASAKLTDEGGPNVFRVYGRDDQQGAMVGDYLAEHWADKEIAILDDGTAWGAGVANAVRRRLRERGVRVAVDETFTPGEAEYSALVSKMQAAGVDVFFLGGLQRETGLIFRQAHDRGYDLRLVASSATASRELSDDRRSGARRHGHGRPTTDMRGAPGRRRSWRNFARRVTSRWDTRSTSTPRFRSGPRRSRPRARSTWTR